MSRRRKYQYHIGESAWLWLTCVTARRVGHTAIVAGHIGVVTLRLPQVTRRAGQRRHRANAERRSGSTAGTMVVKNAKMSYVTSPWGLRCRRDSVVVIVNTRYIDVHCL